MSIYPQPIETPVTVFPHPDSLSYLEMRDKSGSVLVIAPVRQRLTLERIAVTMNDPAAAQQQQDADALSEYVRIHKLTNAQRDAVLAARDWMLTSSYERRMRALKEARESEAV